MRLRNQSDAPLALPHLRNGTTGRLPMRALPQSRPKTQTQGGPETIVDLGKVIFRQGPHIPRYSGRRRMIRCEWGFLYIWHPLHPAG